MDEYIKREDAIKMIEEDLPEVVYYRKEDAIACLECLPAADVVPKSTLDVSQHLLSDAWKRIEQLDELCGESQAPKSEWISVEDRLPDIDTHGKGRYGGVRSVRVLCACKQRDGRTFVKEGYYEPCASGMVVWRIPGSIDSVTHWMPLPEPPMEKENEV